MTEPSANELRLYCVCGQKMKITSNMLGKPGKCVACRQKIRIPSREELPEGTEVIHLKDHPELLRKPQGDIIALPEPPAPAEDEDLVPEADPDDPAPVPLVLFEPLGRLCNYEARVEEQLAALRDGKPAQLDKATLMGYRALARKSRQHLEKRMREELAANSAELQEIRDTLQREIGTLSAASVEYLDYSKRVLPLRKQREVLAFRQQNLRGWLATTDPHMAGGASEPSLVDVPVENLEAPFPLPRELDALPIENAVLKLEEALRQRERADRKLNELHRAHLNGEIPAPAMTTARADVDAERERARTAVAYYRSRLQQVVQDCEDDSAALQAHLGARRRQLDGGQITRDAFQVLEESIFRAQVDIKRARNLATRAMNANTVSDVPNPRGTFLERLARPGTERGLGVDSWMGWLASALALSVIFVPLGEDVPGGNAGTFPGLTLGLFVGAALFGLVATLGARATRALSLGALWLALTAAGAAWLQIETDSIGPAGASLRGGEPWWKTLGGLLLLSAWGTGGAAVVAAFAALPGLRWAGALLLATGVAVASFIVSDYAGVLVATPGMSAVTAEPIPESGHYRVHVPVTNAGNRAFWLGGDPVAVPRPTRYSVEVKTPEGSWVDAGRPTAVLADQANLGSNLDAGLTVLPGGTIEVVHELAPGEYRVRLADDFSWEGSRSREFALEPFAMKLETFFPAEPEGDSAGSRGSGITVELRGVVDGENSQPKIALIIKLANGEELREQFLIGDKVHGEWAISEFNPAHNTITLSDGQRIIIVERGTPEELPR